MRSAHDLDKWLGLIEGLKEKETICLQDASIVNRDTWYSTLKRTYYRENRNKLINFIQDIDRQVADDLPQYKTRIQSLIKGLKQLAENYQDKNFKETINKEISYLISSEIVEEIIDDVSCYQTMIIKVGNKKACVGLIGYILQRQNLNKRLVN